jgi:hypothetical protein
MSIQSTYFPSTYMSGTISASSVQDSLSTLSEGLDDRVRGIVLRTLEEAKTTEPEVILAGDGSYVLRGEDASARPASGRGVAALAAGAVVAGASIALATGTGETTVDDRTLLEDAIRTVIETNKLLSDRLVRIEERHTESLQALSEKASKVQERYLELLAKVQEPVAAPRGVEPEILHVETFDTAVAPDGRVTFTFFSRCTGTLGTLRFQLPTIGKLVLYGVFVNGQPAGRYGEQSLDRYTLPDLGLSKVRAGDEVTISVGYPSAYGTAGSAHVKGALVITR